MYDSPAIPAPVNSSDECCCKSELDALMKDKTTQQIRQMGSYMQDCAYKMSSELEKTVTMEDFEKRMKESSDAIPTMGEGE